MGKTLAWTRGRQLQSVTENGASITYRYDVNGIRTEKQSDGETHEYAYIDGRLHYYEVDGNNMYFTYSDDGTPLALVYNGVKYYYQTNLQGDVIGLINNSGTKVAEYTYDAWGNPTSSEPTTAAGRNNPLRYRGYVYDKDTGWYYLNSRYYNPEVGRWISPDSTDIIREQLYENINATNIFVYCCNNPVNMFDSDGEFAITISTCVIIGIGIGMLLGAGHGAASSYKKTGKVSLKSTIGWAFVGGIVGAAVGYGVGIAIGAEGAYVIGSGGKKLLKTIQTTKITNTKLSNWIRECFRTQGKIGNGGLSDAIRYEYRYGRLVGGKSHIQKGIERKTGLERIIKREKLSPDELNLAKKLLDDLNRALRGK